MQVAKKALAVIVFNGPIQISMTFSLVTLFAGGSLMDCADKISRDLPTTWLINCFYWPVRAPFGCFSICLAVSSSALGVT